MKRIRIALTLLAGLALATTPLEAQRSPYPCQPHMCGQAPSMCLSAPQAPRVDSIGRSCPDTSIAGFRVRTEALDKQQNARTTSLEVSRKKEQKDIDILANKLIDANNRNVPVDTSITNELARHRTELARINGSLKTISDIEASHERSDSLRDRLWAAENASRASPEKPSGHHENHAAAESSNHTTRNWLIAGGVTTAVGTLIYFIGKSFGWWSGGGHGDIVIHDTNCIGSCR